jgi:hypothetical protein
VTDRLLSATLCITREENPVADESPGLRIKDAEEEHEMRSSMQDFPLTTTSLYRRGCGSGTRTAKLPVVHLSDAARRS